MLTILLTLAPHRLTLADTLQPRGLGGGLATVGALSEGFTQVVTSPHYLVGYR